MFKKLLALLIAFGLVLHVATSNVTTVEGLEISPISGLPGTEPGLIPAPGFPALPPALPGLNVAPGLEGFEHTVTFTDRFCNVIDHFEPVFRVENGTSLGELMPPTPTCPEHGWVFEGWVIMESHQPFTATTNVYTTLLLYPIWVEAEAPTTEPTTVAPTTEPTTAAPTEVTEPTTVAPTEATEPTTVAPTEATDPVTDPTAAPTLPTVVVTEPTTGGLLPQTGVEFVNLALAGAGSSFVAAGSTLVLKYKKK
ncbi:MAG: LPXTG cell wall anchor domain-containing protein [Defluviitaleaceae bacterium]|nr:LPXTG cell wall anchor domain-containing protein [Defluviitaleaceae bacterium]